jgi:uncharacterized protein (TIGR03000 family)
MRSNLLFGTLVSSAVLFTPADAAQAQCPYGTGTRAQVRVVVPSPEAKVWIEDTLTRQKGTDRVFVSPPLEQGPTYAYTVKTSWLERGREVTLEKPVKVRPGQESLVDFTVPEAPAERSLTPPIAPESERPLTPPIAPEPGKEEPSRRA